MPTDDDDDDVLLQKNITVSRLFPATKPPDSEAPSVRMSPQQAPSRHTSGGSLEFLKETLLRIRQVKPDAFTTPAPEQLPKQEAINYVQARQFKSTLASIMGSLDGQRESDGAIRQKLSEIKSAVKALLDDTVVFREWEKDLKLELKKARNRVYNGDENITAFTTPAGKFLVCDEKGEPEPCNANAITALRDHLARHQATIMYDHWRNTISISAPGHSRFPRESKEIVVKDLVNSLYQETRMLFTLEHIKFAMGQLAVFHKCHSQLDYFDRLRWDGVDRLNETLIQKIMRLEGTDYQIAIITMQLIASVRRVRFPGTKYDLCPLLIATEGQNKSTFLQVLYGRRNVLAEDILDLTTKEQSEKMRNGINCVELSDTLGDDKKTDARKIKAFISRQDDVGRDAYGRVEDVEHIGRTAVFWHTGNNEFLLTSEEGNRRFAPMKVLGMMNIELLRRERDQIWAQAVELERSGRIAFEDEMRAKGIPLSDDIVYPDIMLDAKY